MQVYLFETASVPFGYELGDFDIFLGGAVDIPLLVLHAYADVEDVGLDALFAKEVHHY